MSLLIEFDISFYLFTFFFASFSLHVLLFLSVVHKVQPQMQGVQPEVVPVAPSSQSVPVAPPQVYVVLLVLMSLKSNFTPVEKHCFPDLWLKVSKSVKPNNT